MFYIIAHGTSLDQDLCLHSESAFFYAQENTIRPEVLGGDLDECSFPPMAEVVVEEFDEVMFEPGDPIEISWAISEGWGETVRIDLVDIETDQVCQAIIESTVNDGQYLWEAEECPGAVAGYRIRVTDLASGASGENDEPILISPQFGTITIDPNPNSLNAPWTITGPSGFSQTGNGDLTLTNRLPGSYTVTWGQVAGWNTPPPETQTLAPNGTLTFTGIYIQQTGTIIIDPNPNSLNAPWSITGPSGFSQTGNGDLTLTNRLPGSYTVTWGQVAGWNTPAAEPQTLAPNGSLTFTGIYIQQTGTIIIDPNPNSLNAPWTITGPSGFSQSGNGDLTLTNRLPGSYTVTWGQVAGWNTPAAEPQTLAPNGSLTFTGIYIQQTGTIIIDPNPQQSERALDHHRAQRLQPEGQRRPHVDQPAAGVLYGHLGPGGRLEHPGAPDADPGRERLPDLHRDLHPADRHDHHRPQSQQSERALDHHRAQRLQPRRATATSR